MAAITRRTGKSRYVRLAFQALWVATLAVASACASKGSHGDGTFGSGSDAAAGDDGSPAPSFTLQITPSQTSATAALGSGGTVAFQAQRLDPGSNTPVDVTAQVTWGSAPSLGQGTIAVPIGGGVFTLSGIGGTTQVTATLSGVSASATLNVQLTGSAYAGGATNAAGQAFMGATPDPNAADAPALEYPLDEVVIPANLPPMDLQWTAGAPDNALYRVHLVTPNLLDVYLYTTGRDLAPDPSIWSNIENTVAGQPVTWTVEAVGTSQQLRTSAPRQISVSSDTIDGSAIYVWRSSTGTFRVIDMTKGLEGALPTSAGALQPGQPCAGCHRISRDGTRFAYALSAPMQFGALAFDPTSNSFVEKIAPAPSYLGTYAAFNPLEKTQVAAMLVTHPDNVPENTAGSVTLELRDPDSNAVVPSNLSSMIGQLDVPSPGQAVTMPDWAPDGSFVVFAAYDNTSHFVRILGDDVVLASIVEAPVSYSGGTFTFGAPKVLVAANATDDPDTGQNDLLPAISPDGSFVAFTRAAGWWSLKTQTSPINLTGRLSMVRRSDGQVVDLVRGSDGSGTTLSSTWPQWAPTMGKHYAWLAYSSERPYGHLLTPSNASCGSLVTGQASCKQLWVTAIDLTKTSSGTADPSQPPFWIPGQNINAQYVSPQWTKAVVSVQ